MIEFRSVTKRFPDDTVAVNDFNFVLPSHKTTVFVGSSGCGKTTLLRMINRMVEPTSGEVMIDDVDVAPRTRSSCGAASGTCCRPRVCYRTGRSWTTWPPSRC